MKQLNDQSNPSNKTYPERKKYFWSQFAKQKVDNAENSELSENMAFSRNPMEEKGILYAKTS